MADTPSLKRPEGPLERVWFRVGEEQRRRLHAYQIASGFRDRASAVAELVGAALTQAEAGGGIPGTKADELADEIRSVLAVLDLLAPGVLGVMRLIAHWAVQAGSLEVDGDELIEETWRIGEAEWAGRQGLLKDGTEKPSDGERETP